MKNVIRYLVLCVFSIIIAEVITLGFFFLRYFTDSLKIPPHWYLATPYFIALITSYIVFLIAKKMNLTRAKELGIFILVIWLLWLVILGKLFIH